MLPYGIASRHWFSSFSAAAALFLQCQGTSDYHLQKRRGLKKDHERRAPHPPYAGIWLPRSRPPRSSVSALIPRGGGCSHTFSMKASSHSLFRSSTLYSVGRKREELAPHAGEVLVCNWGGVEEVKESSQDFGDWDVGSELNDLHFGKGRISSISCFPHLVLKNLGLARLDQMVQTLEAYVTTCSQFEGGFRLGVRAQKWVGVQEIHSSHW